MDYDGNLIEIMKTFEPTAQSEIKNAVQYLQNWEQPTH